MPPSDNAPTAAVTIEPTGRRPSGEAFSQTIIARFLPAIGTCMVWLYLVTYSHGPLSAHEHAAMHNSSFVAQPLGTLWNELFEKYWPMTLAMIFGSLIAGSTPLGGGVVAFPVAVLLIGFTPAEGRDFTVMIQSVGMNAASYLIIKDKPHLLDFHLIATFIILGIPGVLIGLAAELPPFHTILTFQILVLEFAIIFFYLNVLAPRQSPSAIPSPHVSATEPDGTPSAVTISVAVDVAHAKRRREYHDESDTPLRSALAPVTMWIASFAGGFLTANVGSGSDILLYAYGLLGWNLLVPASRRLSDTALTASSVVVMGVLSLVTSACRVMTVGVAMSVMHCWGATCWIVCFGAPLGSLLLTPGLRSQLRVAFYLLAVAQFVGFAILKIRGDAGAWAIFLATTLSVCGGLVAHCMHSKRTLTKLGTPPEGLSPLVIKARLLHDGVWSRRRTPSSRLPVHAPAAAA